MFCDPLLVKKFFQHIEFDGITYVVVGDTRNFPQEIHGDTDIVTDARSLPLFKRSLLQFCHNHNIKIVQMLQHEQSAWYYVLAWFNETGQLRWFNPDICSDYFRFGQLFLKADEVLSDRIPKENFTSDSPKIFIPAPARGFIYYLLKKIDKGSINDRQGDYLSFQWNQDDSGAEIQLNRFWPNPAARTLALAAIHNKWTLVRQDISKFRHILWKSLHFSLKSLYKEISRKFYRIHHPTGMWIAFIGSDGSGKSSVHSLIQQDMAPLFRRIKIFHLRPHVFEFSRGSETPNLNPHSQPVRGYLLSAMKAFYYFLDYTIGFFFSIFPKKICSTLIIFDRYFYDLIIDPKRLRYGGPNWIPSLLQKLIPQPDLIFYLDAPPEVLYIRKQETSLKELSRQREGYLNLTDDLSHATMIDASRPIEEVVEQIERIIVNYLAKRVSHQIKIDLRS